MKLFTALEVPESVSATLDAAVRPLREEHDALRWTPAHQWHLTLAYVGHADMEDLGPGQDGQDQGLDRLARVLRPATSAGPDRIDLRLATAGRFGSRVLWTGVEDEPDGTVTALGERLQEALDASAFPVDTKDVHPHLTLARSRRGGPNVTDALVDAVPDVDASWSVHECVVFESVRQGHGEPNRYEVRLRLPFDGGAR